MNWLRNGRDTSEEMREIVVMDKTRENKTIGLKVKAAIAIYTSKRFVKPFLITATLNCLYVFSGFSLLAFYMITIFKEAGSTIGMSSAFHIQTPR